MTSEAEVEVKAEAECGFRTANVGDAVRAVLLKHHLDAAHPANAPGEANRHSNIKIERPVLEGKINGDERLNFNRDWSNYVGLNNITQNVNRHLVHCCAPDLKNELYGMHTQTAIDNMTDAQLLATLKTLTVVEETILSHRI